MAFVSDKIKELPPYLFSEFQKKKKHLESKGVDVIDLGIGAPDLPTPEFIIDALVKEVKSVENHRYSPYSGCEEFKSAVVDFYLDRYNVSLDKDTEVLALIGSKEGIANLIQAVINPGDAVLVPNPGYPVYQTAVRLAGGVSVNLPLNQASGYTPIYDNIPESALEKAKLMILNYPNNPTSATLNLSTFMEAITFSRKHNLLLAHDAAYDLVTFGTYKAPSVLQVPDAKKHAVEFGSLSKSFNMAGWRIGYIVGNKTVIHALSTLKSNLDSCQFLAIQKAAAIAMKSDLSEVEKNNAVYEERIAVLQPALAAMGIFTERPKGTIFLWARVPKQYTSSSFSTLLLEEAGIIVTPGTAFGEFGEGFIRIALTVRKERLREVVIRLKKLSVKGVFI